MIGWLVRLLRPENEFEPRESAHAFKALMQLAAHDVKYGGEIKPARVYRPRPNWKWHRYDFRRRA